MPLTARKQPLTRHWFHEVLRFGVVGAFAAGTYLIASIWLDKLGTPIWFSVSLARALAMAVAYIGHHFTFDTQPLHPARLRRYLLSRAGILALSVLITYIVVDFLGLTYETGAIAVVILTPLLSYPLFKFWVYR